MAFVNQLQEIENKQSEVGHHISNKEKLRALLRGLRSEFNVSAEVIRATEKPFNEAAAQLILHEVGKEQKPEDKISHCSIY